jgi:hypothetical protein
MCWLSADSLWISGMKHPGWINNDRLLANAVKDRQVQFQSAQFYCMSR